MTDPTQTAPNFTVADQWTADIDGSCVNGDLRLATEAADATRWRIDDWKKGESVCAGQVPNNGFTNISLLEVLDWNLAEFGISTAGLEDWCSRAEDAAPAAYEAAEEREREARESAGFPGRLASDMRRETPDEVDYLIPNLLAPGWTIKNAGREKLGKGTFTIYLVGKLERNEDTVFGDAPGRSVTSVILTEEPRESMSEKLDLFSVEKARIIEGWELAGMSWEEKVDALVEVALREGHGLIFADNVSRTAGIEDEAGTELARAVEYLSDRVRGNRIAAWVDHHHKKGAGSDEDKSRGSTSIGGALDVNLDMFRIKGKPKSRERKLTARGRMRATIWEKFIELNEEGTDYALCGKPAEPQRDEADEQKALMDRMKLVELCETTRREFATKLGVSDSTARNRLDALVEEGHATVEKEKRDRNWVKVYRPVSAEEDE
jgi:AAA domain